MKKMKPDGRLIARLLLARPNVFEALPKAEVYQQTLPKTDTQIQRLRDENECIYNWTIDDTVATGGKGDENRDLLPREHQQARERKPASPVEGIRAQAAGLGDRR
jgi:hypothetical protein